MAAKEAKDFEVAVDALQEYKDRLQEYKMRNPSEAKTMTTEYYAY